MPKAIFTSYQPYGLMYAQRLVKEHGWEAVYCFTLGDVEKDFRAAFPSAICHDYYDAIKCIPPMELRDMPTDPIDPAWLDEFAVDESIALNMMERNDPTSTFTYAARLRLYHDHIRYWSTVLRKFGPDYIIFEEEPHEASDYVLYIVAKKLGIKNIMFLRLPFFRMYPVFDYLTGSEKITSSYAEALKDLPGKKTELSDSLRAYIGKIRKKFDIEEHLYNQKDDLKRLQSGKISRMLYKISRASRFLNIRMLPVRIRSYLRLFSPAKEQFQKSISGSFTDSAITNLEVLRTLKKTARHKSAVKKYYDSIVNPSPDHTCNYIVYALNFQPERTTSPIGGHFVNQLLAIDMLSKSLPEGWKLYVKEHPSQFIFHTFGDTYRSKKYYNDILSLPNVELIPLIYDNYKLIDNAKAIATVTGTMAWEGVVRGKPAMTFGHTWYNPCEGVFCIHNKKDLEAALEKISAGYHPDKDKVNLFANVLEQNSYPAFVGGNQEFIYANITQEKNAEMHLEAILSLKK